LESEATVVALIITVFWDVAMYNPVFIFISECRVASIFMTEEEVKHGKSSTD
jgi:hypothetical protein